MTFLPGPWPLYLPDGTIDPFEEAACWLLEGEREAVLPGPAAVGSKSVHARVLLEHVPHLERATPAKLLRRPGLRIVLAMPAPEQLERLDRARFHAATEWFLVPSRPGTAERDHQEAWIWAHANPAPTHGHNPGGRALDPFELLTDTELWALSVRAGMVPDRRGPVRGPNERHIRLLPGKRG